jgi:hypothetical protein
MQSFPFSVKITEWSLYIISPYDTEVYKSDALWEKHVDKIEVTVDKKKPGKCNLCGGHQR